MRTAARSAPVGVVRVGTFGGVSGFPLGVAERLGLPAAHGVSLVVTRTTDSTSLRDDLMAGRIDVAHAAPDNAIAWADGAASTPGSDAPDVAVWLRGSNGPISLVSRHPSAAALRGARIGVDAPTTGFAPLLLRLLDQAGLSPDDVELVAIGATRARHQALLAGDIDASMLTLPWTPLAVAAGHHELADHATVAAGMLTSAAIVRRDWVAHGDVALRYRRTLADAMAWLRDPGSLDTATGWLAEDLGLDLDAAARVLAAMADPVVGWPAGVDPDPEALDETVALRAAAGLRALRSAPEYLVRA